jgi:hypothetical protein
VAEEKFLGDYEDLDPLIIVGYEGVWGFLLWIVLLPIFQNVSCDIPSLCTNGVIEDTLGALKDYQANPILILLSFGMVVVVCLLNIAGVNVTKYGSSAQRTTCDLLRNMFVWVFFLTIPVYDYMTDTYWRRETFHWAQGLGFLVLTFGVLVYNEILVLPFWKMNLYTKVALEEREKIEEVERKTISVYSGEQQNSSMSKHFN